MTMRRLINLVEGKYDHEDGSSYDRSDPVVAKYMEGSCYALALAHHRRFGWPLYVMGADAADGPVEELDFFHGMVKHPTGVLIDISGPHDVAELMAAWGEPLMAITEQQLVGAFNDYMRRQTLNGLAEADRVIDDYLMPRYPGLYR